MELADLNAAFRTLGIATDFAENHGALAGLVCARGQVAIEEWLDLLAPEYSGGTAGVLPAEVTLLYQRTRQQLSDTGFGFELQLPDDQFSLTIRTEALGAWCKGFLYGLAAGGVKDFSPYSEEVAELIGDLVEISRACYEDDDEEAADEAAYLEVCEYVRAGVMLIFEEMEAERDSGPEDKIIH